MYGARTQYYMCYSVCAYVRVHDVMWFATMQHVVCVRIVRMCLHCTAFVVCVFVCHSVLCDQGKLYTPSM